MHSGRLQLRRGVPSIPLLIVPLTELPQLPLASLETSASFLGKVSPAVLCFLVRRRFWALCLGLLGGQKLHLLQVSKRRRCPLGWDHPSKRPTQIADCRRSVQEHGARRLVQEIQHPSY